MDVVEKPNCNDCQGYSIFLELSAKLASKND